MVAYSVTAILLALHLLIESIPDGDSDVARSKLFNIGAKYG